MKTKILFLGSGYTTVWAYKYLLKNLSNSDLHNVDIQVISATEYHAFHGFTGEFLSGFFPLALRHTANSYLFPMARVTKGLVNLVDQQKKYVQYIDIQTNTEQYAYYDHLIIGMGALDHSSKIKGMSTYTLGVKQSHEIEQIRQRLFNLLTDNAKHEVRNIVVCGAGFAGVEVCANLAEFVLNLEKQFPEIKYTYNIHLVHSSDQILNEIEGKFDSLIRYSNQTLTKYGIQLHTNSKIEEFTEHGLLFENGNELASDLTVTTLGQKVCAPKAAVPFQKDISGRIVGTKYLTANGFDDIWVGGDVANIPHISGNGPCRSDALWAIKHGTRIGRNLARTLHQKPLKQFGFYGLGQAASLGYGKAFTELYGITMTGKLAWWVRFMFFLYFMPSRQNAWHTFKAYLNKNTWAIPKLPDIEQAENQIFKKVA